MWVVGVSGEIEDGEEGRHLHCGENNIHAYGLGLGLG